MSNTWISELMKAGLKLVGWPSRKASEPPCKAVNPTMQEELSDFQFLEAQTSRLLTFQNDFLLPLMEGLKKGPHSPAASNDSIARFVRRAQELGSQCTHPALGNMADTLHGLVKKDFGLYETYQDLSRLRLSIEAVEHTMDGRSRELRQAYPRRPTDRR